IDRWWKGQLRAWFSLEIVSVEGNVYFFIRTQSKFRFAIESQIYAQYPSAEISEVDDYVKYTEKYIATNQWSMFGVEWKLSKEDAYPIKTYVDYGLDKANVDVEEKIDPLSGVIEMMGSLGKGEQLWVQILVQATQDRFEKEGTFVKKQNWVKEADKLIEKLIKEKGSKIVGEEKKEERDLAKMTKLEKDVLEAVERSTTKPGFDVGIRTMYLSPKDYFRPPIIQALLGMFRQFNTPHLNGFKIGSATGISYPWEGWGNKVENMKEDMFEAYMERGWFYRPNRRDPFVLNTEELATIFHFPGRAIETPTFERVESTKAEPPANLPM
ncbi:MAG: hypothetical protein OEX08_03580, partial [Candidatus Nomurabacteria bacterium]|nr:hypothetical protein [Candidatus Nomurabacteria bacterium]